MSIFSLPTVDDSFLKVWREPKVTRLAKTELEADVWGELHDHPHSFTGGSENWHDGEWLTEFAGRECYQSFHNPANRTTEDYIRNVRNQQHLSVFRHVNVTYRLEGVSRSLTHELIRHKFLDPSQLSQRYVDSREAWVVAPPFVLTDYELYIEWAKMTEHQMKELATFEAYVQIRHPELPQKKRREAVRALAPNCIETKMVVTASLHAWLEVLPKRWNSHADAEIQRLFGTIADDLKTVYPVVFEEIAYS